MATKTWLSQMEWEELKNYELKPLYHVSISSLGGIFGGALVSFEGPVWASMLIAPVLFLTVVAPLAIMFRVLYLPVDKEHAEEESRNSVAQVAS